MKLKTIYKTAGMFIVACSLMTANQRVQAVDQERVDFYIQQFQQQWDEWKPEIDDTFTLPFNRVIQNANEWKQELPTEKVEIEQALKQFLKGKHTLETGTLPLDNVMQLTIQYHNRVNRHRFKERPVSELLESVEQVLLVDTPIELTIDDIVENPDYAYRVHGSYYDEASNTAILFASKDDKRYVLTGKVVVEGQWVLTPSTIDILNKYTH